jgi:hypothetical protein
VKCFDAKWLDKLLPDRAVSGKRGFTLPPSVKAAAAARDVPSAAPAVVVVVLLLVVAAAAVLKGG